MAEAVGFGASVAFLAALLNLLNPRWSFIARFAILGVVVGAIAATLWAIGSRGQPF